MNTTLARLIAGQICVHGSMAGMRLAAPLLALREGHSAAAVGLLVALFALTQVFLALPAGRYADRHGIKRPVGYSVAVACVGAGMAVVFPTFPVLCVSALMTGAAAGAAPSILRARPPPSTTPPPPSRRRRTDSPSHPNNPAPLCLCDLSL